MDRTSIISNLTTSVLKPNFLLINFLNRFFRVIFFCGSVRQIMTLICSNTTVSSHFSLGKSGKSSCWWPHPAWPVTPIFSSDAIAYYCPLDDPSPEALGLHAVHPTCQPHFCLRKAFPQKRLPVETQWVVPQHLPCSEHTFSRKPVWLLYFIL